MVNPSIGHDLVLGQLAKILASDLFKPSKILSDFLKYIVTETIEGRSEFLKEYTIGVNALFKRGRFDPQSDASVRIHAGRLRKLLAQYYTTTGIDDILLLTLPKGSYVPVFEWRRSDASPEPATRHLRPTIAVIPFSAELSPAGVAVGDGLCDQLCTELTAFQELSVISYYSSRRLAESALDLKQIGQLLDASHLLTGQVQSSASQVRVRVQLIATDNLQQVWAKTYQKEESTFNVFAVQDDIVNHIVNEIAGNHGAMVRDIVKKHTDQHPRHIGIYDAVFWYYYFVNEQNETVFQEALQAVLGAVAGNKNDALGWAILGEIYVAGHFNQYACGIDHPLEEAVRCATTALNLDARCHHAYQALGLAWLFLHNREACIKTVHQWLALESNVASVAGGLGFCLICCGEFESGYRMLADSIHLNPFYPWWFNAGLSIYYYQKERWEESAYWAEKMRHRHLPWTLILMSAAKKRAGQTQEAKDLRNELETLFPGYVHPKSIAAFIQSEAICESLLQELR